MVQLPAAETAEYIKLSPQQISRCGHGAGKIDIFHRRILPFPRLSACTSDNAPEQQWNSLNPTQKAAFAAFLDTLRNP